MLANQALTATTANVVPNGDTVELALTTVEKLLHLMVPIPLLFIQPQLTRLPLHIRITTTTNPVITTTTKVHPINKLDNVTMTTTANPEKLVLNGDGAKFPLMPILVTATNIVPKHITKTPITPPVTLLPVILLPVTLHPVITNLLVTLLLVTIPQVIPAPIHPVTPKTTEPAKPMLTANTETPALNGDGAKFQPIVIKTTIIINSHIRANPITLGTLTLLLTKLLKRLIKTTTNLLHTTNPWPLTAVILHLFTTNLLFTLLPVILLPVILLLLILLPVITNLLVTLPQVTLLPVITNLLVITNPLVITHIDNDQLYKYSLFRFFLTHQL
jgi:hypothetical protein